MSGNKQSSKNSIALSKMGLFSQRNQALLVPREAYLAGRYQQAEELYHHLRTQLHDSKACLQLELDAGMCHYVQGNFKLALACYKRAVNYWKKLYGAHRSQEVILLEQAIKDLEKDIAKQSLSASDVLKLDKKLPPEFSEDICRIFNNLGNICLHPDLLHLKHRLYSVASKFSSDRDKETLSSDLYYAIAQNNLAGLIEQKDANTAQRLHAKAICIFAAYFNTAEGAGLQCRASSVLQLANLHYHQGEHDIAHKHYMLVKTWLIKFSEQQNRVKLHPDLGICCFNMALNFIGLNDTQAANDHLQEALNIFNINKMPVYVALCEQALTNNLFMPAQKIKLAASL